MKILIIGAMDEEIKLLCSLVKANEQPTVCGISHWLGHIGSNQVIICQSGIGKVNATITTTIMLNHYQPDLVINIGSAGGIGKNISISDIVVATELSYHDVDVCAFGYDFGQIPMMPSYYTPDRDFIEKLKSADSRLPIKFGLILSGDSFINSNNYIKNIKSKFPNTLAIDMESTAIAQTCYKFKIPFSIIRIISDHADNTSNADFKEQINQVSDQLAGQLIGFIKNF
ncbi:5'-methylthioadenosine/adenosylhomocysteine nucleosidase [Thiotrichales bacterium 19S11-10]|nr:5'-methylthioadenosine/adenosylhomocysteine nucleosidase [Thiotrichales bacterium 19S11-10]